MGEKYLWLILPIVVALLVVPAIADEVTVTATVPPYVSVVFNYNTVDFGAVGPGSTDIPALNQYSGIYNVSVTSNTGFTVSAYRTAWSPYDILTLKFAVGTSVPLSPQITLTTSYESASSFSAGQYTLYNAYWLSVPSDAPRGSYSTTVTITFIPFP
jgi:hypothetical protein